MADIYEILRILANNQIEQEERQRAREARNKEEDATIKLLTDQIRLLTEEKLAEVNNDREIAEENIYLLEDENYYVESPVNEDFSNPEDFIHSDIISAHELQSENDNSYEMCCNSYMELDFESEKESTSSIVVSDVMPSELDSKIGTAVLSACPSDESTDICDVEIIYSAKCQQSPW